MSLNHGVQFAAGESKSGRFEGLIANNAQLVELEFADGLTAQFLPTAGQQYFVSFNKITSVSSATGVALW